MDLFSSTNVLLGSVSVNGNATTAEDNSAVFLGATSTTPIDHALFWVSTGFPGFSKEGDLAINQLSMLIEIPTPAPEPATAFLLGAGAIGLTVLRRQRRHPAA